MHIRPYASFVFSLVVSAPIACPVQAAEPGFTWSPYGNGEKGEISFVPRDPPGYVNNPLRVKLARQEQRIALSFMVGHGSNLESRLREVSIREAHCEPTTLCRVTIVEQADKRPDKLSEVRVDFISPGEGKLAISARSGVSFYTDTWPIAADPMPDGITHDAGNEIVIPDPGTGVKKVVVSVAATFNGKRLRGPVGAHIEDIRPPRGSTRFWVDYGKDGVWKPCDLSSCTPAPFTGPAAQRNVEITWRGRGHATLVLTAGNIAERIPIRPQEPENTSAGEAFRSR